MPNSPARPELTGTDPSHTTPSRGFTIPETWGPIAYRSLAVLALMLALTSGLLGTDLPDVSQQLWAHAHGTLAAALLTFLLAR
jgi:hypothetical protein